MAGDLEPRFTERIDFRFEDLFDPEDPLAQFVMNLSRGANDLLLGNRRLLKDFAVAASGESTPLQHDVIYDIKTVASDAWELAKFIQSSQNSAKVAPFIANRMPAQARRDLEDALAAFEPSESDSPETKTFKNKLISARDQDSHYSELNAKLLKRALRNLNTDFEGQPNETSLLKGVKFKDFYAPFATEMDWQLFHQMDAGDLETLKIFVGQLNEVVGRLLTFSETAVECWFRDHAEATTRVDLSASDGTK